MKQQSQPLPYPTENLSIYRSDDQIDLRDLFDALWVDKLMIILVTVLFTAGGVGFAFLTQEWWSASAKITEAQPKNLAGYQQQVQQFQPVFNLYQDDGTVLVSKELNDLVDAETLFKRFVNTFGSSNNKKAFLDHSVEFQELKTTLNGASLTENESRALYAKWFDRISASKADKKDRNSPYFIDFQTTNKQSSFDLLTSYVAFTEFKVREDAFSNLNATLASKRNELTQQKKILESQAKNKLLVETERTKYAADIARAAGVESPIQTGNDNELFGIDLGLKGLEAKVHALESVKNLSVIEPRLQQINAKLDMLKSLEIDKNAEFQTFRFLENVEQPITRDKPKRALIVALSALFGGILGVAIVLIRFVFRKED